MSDQHRDASTLSRRRFVGALAGSAVAGLASSATGAWGAVASPARNAGATSPAPASRPNILLVVVDDLGWGEVGAYGQEVIGTPVLDGLAADGLRFTQAYVTPTCAPTRCSLMTGMHTGHARVKSNADAARGLLPEDQTVAEVLRDAGYTTGLVGKWGLGPDNGANPSHPNSQGFDYFFGYINQRHAHDYWPTYLWRNDQRLEYPENAAADVTYAIDLVTDEALRFIDRSANPGGAPFFLNVCYTTPHAPNEVPSDAPYSDEDWPEGERNHAAQVTYTDSEIGKLLRRLDERGVADDTLVLVVSDNGPHTEGSGYAHVGSTLPHDPEFFNSNGPLRGIKRDLYEGGIRVPFLVRLPAQMRSNGAPAPGSIVRNPVAAWDFLPTLAEVGGAAAPGGIDGISFLPSLVGDDQPSHEYLYWEFREGGYDQAVRWGKWKGLRLDGSDQVELYEVLRDIGETTDVAASHPAQVRQAERFLADAVS